MSDLDPLSTMYPRIGRGISRVRLAKLPTPLQEHAIPVDGGTRPVWVKHDEETSERYGGNKVRKLEYLLCPRNAQAARRFATFGTVGSHHALATALHARALGYECSCFLAHQRKVPGIAAVLGAHAAVGTEIVRYGGAYAARIATLRKHLWHRQARVVPAGGSSWHGTLGFVNAALELAAQIDAGEAPVPRRLYVATGTLGTAAGLALGLALAGLPTEVQAVRVSHTSIANEAVLERLMQKTVLMMRRIEPAVPERLAEQTRIRLRHEFFAGGYAHSDAVTASATELAKDALGLELETTYTGKAMAGLLADLRRGREQGEILFWNTCNASRLPAADPGCVRLAMPAEFLSYLS